MAEPTKAVDVQKSSAKRFTRARFVALLAVLGPGLLAGLSDDDPAGITTYSVLGTHYGYQMLWVLTISTVALILFQQLGARIGVVTGQGLAGLGQEVLLRGQECIGLFAENIFGHRITALPAREFAHFLLLPT